jgi:hypothetical protein
MSLAPEQGEQPSAKAETPLQQPEPAPLARARPARRWLRWLALFITVAALLYWFHAPLLRTCARGLIVDESPEGTDTVLLMHSVNGDRGFEEAARLYHAGAAERVLVIDGPPSRTARLGITLPFDVIARRELADRAVPSEAVVVLRAQTWDDWGKARTLAAWMGDHPDAQLCGLSDKFASRQLALVFARTLGEATAGRVRWRVLADRRYDETNWWRCKPGVLAFFGGYLCLGHAWWFGEPRRLPEWDPDEYVSQLCTD